MDASGSGSSASKDFWESFDLEVLEESFSHEGSVDQPEGGASEQPQASPPQNNPSASRGEGADPSDQPPGVVPYPYQPDEVIGGDSVLNIQNRLLRFFQNFGMPEPSVAEINMARIEAEDLFEVKVKIISRMAELDPTGDWMERGARALANPRTATGEESLEKLYEKWEDLDRAGLDSKVFTELQGKRFERR
ncbi:hypothetical protein MLD38_014783 [Melastoma candidum]|uniref:Uncharacterized protein n=1 Tax=Melastoma candidum TaxID=119954 RepID=A0ACB9RDI0_9MYRT|nr:hypothetical protein MLD38_014783 [Melastoma candidum]